MATATEPGLRCAKLSKSFRDGSARTLVLNNADFEAERRQVTFVVGPSGCGKSTFLAIAAGLLKADSGDVDILGERVTAMRAGAFAAFRSRNIGIVLQQFQLLPALTVVENVAVPLLVLGWSTRRAREWARRAIDRTGLGEHAAKYPMELSVGQKQRMAIARATVHEPGLILCDEPTAALDRDTATTIMGLIRSLATNNASAVVVVTHDNSLIERDDRVWSIQGGALRRQAQAPVAGAGP
ncbi:MAG: ABC transporter ATP-binding protein [Hyphomicrobiaceae bacterium]